MLIKPASCDFKIMWTGTLRLFLQALCVLGLSGGIKAVMIDCNSTKYSLLAREATPEEDMWKKYLTYNEIKAWLLTTCRQHNPFANITLHEIGQSSTGEPLWVVSIESFGKSLGTRAVFIDALMVPMEFTTGSIALYTINELTSKNHTDLLQNTTFYILPVANPNGYRCNINAFRESSNFNYKEQGTWKNSPNCSDLTQGVNIFSNFDFQWGSPSEPEDSFASPTGVNYRGPKKCSEPECAAIVKFIRSHQDIQTYISLHGFHNMWALPYTYSKKEKPDHYIEMGRLGAAIVEAINDISNSEHHLGRWTKFNDPRPSNMMNRGPRSGTPIDWAVHDAKVKFGFYAAFGSDLSPFYKESEIERVCEDAWRGIKVAATKVDVYERPIFIAEQYSSHAFPVKLSLNSLFFTFISCLKYLAITS